MNSGVVAGSVVFEDRHLDIVETSSFPNFAGREVKGVEVSSEPTLILKKTLSRNFSSSREPGGTIGRKASVRIKKPEVVPTALFHEGLFANLAGSGSETTSRSLSTPPSNPLQKSPNPDLKTRIISDKKPRREQRTPSLLDSGTFRGPPVFKQELHQREEMRNVTRILRSIYKCIMGMCLNPALNISIQEDVFSLSAVKTDISTEDIQNEINSYIESSLDLKIYQIMDDDGKLISLKMLASLVQKKYNIENSKLKRINKKLKFLFPNVDEKHFVSEDDVKAALMQLPFPVGLERLSEKEVLYLRMLQRLYPQGSTVSNVENTCTQLPVFPPREFGMICEQLVPDPTTRFELCEEIMNWNDIYMPISQKFRVLNYLRTSLMSFFQRKAFDPEKHQPILSRILNIGRGLKQLELSIACDEIEEILERKAPIKFDQSDKVISFSKFREHLVSQDPLHEGLFTKLVDALAGDFKILASASIAETTLDQFDSVKGSVTTYQNNLADLIVGLFEYIKGDASRTIEILKDKRERVKFSKMYRFVIHLMNAMVMREDYFSSFTIHAALNRNEIVRFIEAAKSKRMKVKGPYFSVDHETWLIAQQLKELFNDDSIFKNLRDRMQEREKNRINFIPSALLLTGGLVRRKEAMTCRSDSRKMESASSSELDLEGLHLTGKQLLALESTLKNAEDFYTSGPLKYQTDIKKYLLSLNI